MLILVLLLLATIAIGFVPGLAFFALVPGLVLLALVAWMGLGFATGRTPARAVRKRVRRSPELLGPGGPDDPDH